MAFAVTSALAPHLTDKDRAEIIRLESEQLEIGFRRDDLDDAEREIKKRWTRLTGRLRQRAFREQRKD